MINQFAIRKTEGGSSSYAVFRKTQLGKGISGNFRFSKTNASRAQVFNSLHDAGTVVRGLKTRDSGYASYTIYPV